jgi:signal transduction histidine kinase
MLQRKRLYREQAVETILRNTTHLNRLIQDLSDAAQLIVRRLELERRSTDLVPVVRTVVEEAEASSGNHCFRVEGLERPCVGYWDPDRIRQIVQNLVSNAVKYSPDGGEVRVTLQATDSTAELAVRDQGVGIPPEALPRLFDRFYRGPGVKTSAQGLGLGLTIVRGLVEAHEGRISVDSTVGAGSTFTICLPRQAAGAAEA